MISVVLSFRNEEQTIPLLIERLEKVFGGGSDDYELIFVNDASSDRSLQVLLEKQRANPAVRVINMSRRFGVSECVLAGMQMASGDAVIYMDTDLQDPPEVIPSLIQHWRNGAEVVHTVRTHRLGESRMKMQLTRLAYRLIQYCSTINLTVDAGDFKLLACRAVTQLLSLKESDPYLRGLVVWLGFQQAFVPYQREPRGAGKTHFPFFSRNPWKTLVTGLTSFSFTPIYALLVLAGLGTVAGCLSLAIACVAALLGTWWATWPALIGILLLFWASLIGAIGIVGIYVARTYKDARSRPSYIIESTIGFDRAPRATSASHASITR